MSKRWLLSVVLLGSAALGQEHDHSAPAAPAAIDHSAHTAVPAAQVPDRDESAVMQEARHSGMMLHGDAINYLLLGERFERLEGDRFNWEAQGWVGRDLDKLWFKTEGHREQGATERAEVQALFSRAVASFWDLQAGLRHDTGTGATRTHAVFGLQGLAPYWFEVDLAAFVSERGDASARLELEYELRFTQRLLLQPRVELNYSFADDFAAGIGQGFSDTSVGLRLRYEIRREFAPYVGVEWSRASGATAQLLVNQGREREELSVVAGVRVWY
jgi:copper resistance protein B